MGLPKIIITQLHLSQPCACFYTDATPSKLCVLLLAREYQAHFLEIRYKGISLAAESICLFKLKSPKGKIPLYTLPILTPRPTISFNPPPTIQQCKDWMHEYDIHLDEMVDESERMLKRLDELIRKCDLSEQEITAFSSVKTFKMTREKLDDNCKCIYEPSKCILAWKELQRTRPPVDQLAEIEEEERMERLFREGKAKGMCGCCDCWPDDLSEEESMEWMTGRSSALMVNAYSTPRAFPNALIQHTKELLIGSPASSPSDISDKSGITSSSSKRSTNSVNKKKKGARGKRASGSGMTMAEKETLDFLRKTDSCHLN